MVHNNKSFKIAHYLASSGLCSRREGERLIQSKKIGINGTIIDHPAHRVTILDHITHDGVKVELINNAKLYGYYKPAKVMVTRALDEGVTVFDLLEPILGRLLSVGRLDYYSEGLLLLTNSNNLCSSLMHSDLPRVYEVFVQDRWRDIMSDFVQKPFTIDGVEYKPWQLLKCSHVGNGSWIRIKLMEGKNREIRRVCSFFNLYIKRLIRTEYGPYKLKGDAGRWWNA